MAPDPVRIPLGTLLRWRFRADNLNALRLQWTIYFDHGHPLIDRRRRLGSPVFGRQFDLRVTTSGQPNGQHVGRSIFFTAATPGEYKYGIRLLNLDEEEELGDEDPMLIVF